MHLIFFSKIAVLRKPCWAYLFCSYNYTPQTENFTFEKQFELSFFPLSIVHFLLLGKFTCQEHLLLVPYIFIKVSSEKGNSTVNVKHLTGNLRIILTLSE